MIEKHFLALWLGLLAAGVDSNGQCENVQTYTPVSRREARELCVGNDAVCDLHRLRGLPTPRDRAGDVDDQEDHSTRGASAEAIFKAGVLNGFIAYNKLHQVYEFQYSGADEAYLSLANYPRYTGFDTSIDSWNTFYKRYQNDPTKNYNYHDGIVPETCYKRQADVVLSLNAIGSLSYYDYLKHMESLFVCSSKYVIIYASNFDKPQSEDGKYYRRFTNWVETYMHDRWRLVGSLLHRFAHTTESDFYFFKNREWEQDCGEADEPPLNYKWWLPLDQVGKPSGLHGLQRPTLRPANAAISASRLSYYHPRKYQG